MVCERGCVKDGVWQSCVWKLCVKKGMWKMLADKVACESCVWKMVCDKVVLCVTCGRREEEEDEECHECHACHAKRPWMWDGATPAMWNEGGCHQVPRLPRKVPRRHARLNRAQGRHRVPWAPRLSRKTKMDVRLRHACHVKRRWMSPSATPATQSAAASRATKPGPRAPPSTMSATPATQNDRGCEIAPRLPRETKVDVTKCHACHAKCRGVTRD